MHQTLSDPGLELTLAGVLAGPPIRSYPRGGYYAMTILADWSITTIPMPPEGPIAAGFAELDEFCGAGREVKRRRTRLMTFDGDPYVYWHLEVWYR